MTTPAVNHDAIITQPAYRNYLRTDGGIDSYFLGHHQFRRRKRQRPASVSTVREVDGRRPPTEWFHTDDKFFLGSLSYTEDLNPWTGYLSQTVTGNGMLTTGYPDIGGFQDSLWERAINGALEKLKGQDVNLSLAFKERKKTADTFSKGTTSIRKSIETFQRKNRGKLWQRVLRGARQLPSEWLSLSYGWTPTLNDILGSCKELAGLEERSEATSGLVPYHVKVSEQARAADESGLVDPAYAYLAGSVPLMMNQTVTEFAYASFYYRLGNIVLQKLSELGITNPASLAWETLPYSFVYDWLQPLGGWINLLDADLGWDYLDGSITRVRTRTAIGSHFANNIGTWYLSSGKISDMRINQKKMVRSVFESPPWAVFPGIRNPFSSSGAPKRVANAMSLLSTALSRK